MLNALYTNEHIYLLPEQSTIPWVKIFTHAPYKELSHCPPLVRAMLFEAAMVVEQTMLDFYQPEKINIASFGNYLPHVHLHVMARFKEDSHFPESMWGVKQRESLLSLPPFEDFATQLHHTLENHFG